MCSNLQRRHSEIIPSAHSGDRQQGPEPTLAKRHRSIRAAACTASLPPCRRSTTHRPKTQRPRSVPGASSTSLPGQTDRTSFCSHMNPLLFGRQLFRGVCKKADQTMSAMNCQQECSLQPSLSPRPDNAPNSSGRAVHHIPRRHDPAKGILLGRRPP